jgi:hypothetical protein
VRRALLLIGLALALAGCGGDAGSATPRVVDAGTAIGLNGDDVIVRGYYSHDANASVGRMCTSLAESYPPTCANPALPVSNLSDKQEKALKLKRDPETGARWSGSEVELAGRIEEGALVVE